MSGLVAILDANVLYPAPLRDLLMHLATGSLFRAKVTNRIHEEWIRNLLLNRPSLTRPALERTRDLMNAAVEDFLVEGYQEFERELELPDEDDRHVLAAAVRGGANVIVTFNLKDSPKPELEKYGIEALHPDDFIV